MKRTLPFLLLLNFLFLQSLRSQDKSDTLFNYSYWNGVADRDNYNAAERAELISTQKKIFEGEKAHQHVSEKELVWVNQTPPASKKGYGQNTVNAGPCNNVDFETGTFAGWTRSTGYNPLANPVGCCASPNGDQAIVSGSGIDPFGGFPVVCPNGGNYSLKLGSTAIGGIADRISQTIFVTPSNVNFTYNYAVVINDGGHQPAQQPRFTFTLLDTLGNALLFSSVSSVGLANSFIGAPGNASPVFYKNWTPVTINLSAYLGQNVTLEFTVYDCSPTGHFGYAYIDGEGCASSLLPITQTICPGSPICVSGFSIAIWDGPGITAEVNSCINPTVSGTYTCSTITMSGSAGPTFTYNISMFDTPTISLTAPSSNICGTQYTFNASSSIASGSVVSYLWSFGDAGTSTVFPDPIHTYATPGTYSVLLEAFSDAGCKDSAFTSITLLPAPDLSFTFYSACVNSTIQFTNTSTIFAGSISGYSWDLGDGTISTLQNPALAYTAPGIYTVSLSGISDLNCNATITQTLEVYPEPQVSFSAGNLCEGNTSSFSPTVSLTTGTVANLLWDFGDGNTSALASPTHSYASTGMYNVSLTALSNHSCSLTYTNDIQISPAPVMAFITSSVDACTPTFTFINTSAISSGSIAYTWNLESNITSNLTNPTHTFSAPGNYTVSLTGISDMGCAAASTATSALSLHAPPAINYTAAPAVCENSSLTISTSTVNSTIISYSWDFGDAASGAANTSALPNPSHLYSAAAIYSINLITINNFNCQLNTSLTVTVNPSPVVSLNTGTICSGTTFTLIPSGASTYTFLNGGSVVAPLTTSSYSVTGTSTAGCISSNTAVGSVFVNITPTISINSGTICADDSFTLVPSGAFTYTLSGGNNVVSPAVTSSYTVSGTSAAGCTGNTALSLVTINPKPIITVNSGTLCSGQIFTLVPGGSTSFTFSSGSNTVMPLVNTSYTVSGASSSGCTTTAVSDLTVFTTPTITVNSGTICFGKSFTLSPTGASSYTYSSGNAVVSPSITTSYVVTGVSANGCFSSSNSTSTVTVNALPSLSVSGTTSICEGETTTLVAQGANSYLWNTNVTAAALVVSPMVTTVYTLTGTDLNNCSNTITYTQQVTDCTGLSSFAKNLVSLTIYPNPSAGEFTISSGLNIDLTVVNGLGQLIKFVSLNENNNRHVTVNELAEGIYFLNSSDPKKPVRQKIIVTK